MARRLPRVSKAVIEFGRLVHAERTISVLYTYVRVYSLFGTPCTTLLPSVRLGDIY